MNAPNLVYATVAGMYPRLLADDGVHEALVLPYNERAVVEFEFYREGRSVPVSVAQIISAHYLRPDGAITNLQFTPFATLVEFDSTLPAGGLCVIVFLGGADSLQYQCYPFRVLRPTEVLAP